MKKTVHIINSLSLGGAERMLQKLSVGKSFEQHEYFTLLSLGRVGEEMFNNHSKVMALDLKRNPLNVFHLFRSRPDVIVSWLYHSCVFSVIYKIFFPRTKIIWNIRHSMHGIKNEKVFTRLVIKLMERVRFLPDAIIFNSKISSQQHSFFLTENTRCQIIPNGFDPEKFKSSGTAPTKVIGVFARSHPMKGHHFFLDVFASLKDQFQDYKILFVGEGCSDDNLGFKNKISSLGLNGRVELAGPKQRMEEEYSKIDILIIPSLWGEAFPNVLGEAMLCEKLCVVSDVGDSAYILNDPRWVFSPGDHEELREKLIRILSLNEVDREKIGKQNRQRVIDNFSIASVEAKMSKLIEALN